MALTSMNNVVLVKVVYGAEDLLDCLRGILFRELALFTNSIEELAALSQLCNDVVFVLLQC